MRNLFLIIFLICIPRFVFAIGAGEDCTKLVQTLYQDMYGPSAKELKDLEKETGYFYWGRARAAIEATPNEKLESFFSKVGKSDLEEMFFSIKGGFTKVTPQEEKMVEELWHMVDDLGEKPFWGASLDRGYAIREALRAHEAKLGFSSNPAFAAELTDLALSHTEPEVLSRALSEHLRQTKYPNSKWYDSTVRFFSPHYEKVKKVLEANNSIRQRLQYMYAMDKPALEAVAKYQVPLKLNDAELRTIEGLASDTAKQLADARGDISKLYGTEISADQPLKEAGVRIRDLAKRAEVLKGENKVVKLELQAEGDMDQIDNTIGNAWNREKGTSTGMPVSEKNDVHLQIRYPQYTRETPQMRQHYLDVTETRAPKNSEYAAQSEWTVTVQNAEPKTRTVSKTETSQVSDGNGGFTTETKEVQVEEQYTDYYTTTYTRTRAEVLQARYEEVLNNKVLPSTADIPTLPPAEARGAYATSASNGSPQISSYDSAATSRILQQGGKARQSESVFRSQIASSTGLIDSFTNDAYKTLRKDPSSLAKKVSELENEQKNLVEMRNQLQSYRNLTPEATAAQWSSDIHVDFVDRNEKMISRFDHMIKRIDHLSEQARRAQPSLVYEYTLPTYITQLDQLKKVRDSNVLKRNVGIGVISAAGVGAAASNQQVREQVKALFHNR